MSAEPSGQTYLNGVPTSKQQHNSLRARLCLDGIGGRVHTRDGRQLGNQRLKDIPNLCDVCTRLERGDHLRVWSVRWQITGDGNAHSLGDGGLDDFAGKLAEGGEVAREVGRGDRL